MIVICGMLMDFLKMDGVITTILAVLGMPNENYLMKPEAFRTIYVASDIWQNCGWNSIIYMAALSSIDQELYEAAAIDGSSFSHTLWNIIFPICRPILVTVAIIQVFSCWNEFSFALVLIKDVGLQTVPLALTQFKGQFASDYPKQMAAMLITMAPIVVLYFAFSKQIINGMVAGAVKG